MPGHTFSIITPSLNRADSIQRAVESVLSQGHANIEFIIMDGGSTDGTLQLLQGYPGLKVISQPDRGLYDALNKGIRMADGEIIGLLNTDDHYEAGVFEQVERFFQLHPEVFSLSGGTNFHAFQDGMDRVILRLPPVSAADMLTRATTGIAAINGFFFRRSVFERVGLFDLKYRLASDRDFILRLVLASLAHGSLPMEVYSYCSHPGSLTIHDVWKEAMVDENLALAAAYSSVNTPQPVRRACRRWERFYNLELSGHFLRARELKSTWKYFSRACRRHWHWPITFLCLFPFHVLRYYLKRGELKT
jgi:glycosyltransferase involved in cell wall biosynthesis